MCERAREPPSVVVVGLSAIAWNATTPAAAAGSFFFSFWCLLLLPPPVPFVFGYDIYCGLCARMQILRSGGGGDIFAEECRLIRVKMLRCCAHIIIIISTTSFDVKRLKISVSISNQVRVVVF